MILSIKGMEEQYPTYSYDQDLAIALAGNITNALNGLAAFNKDDIDGIPFTNLSKFLDEIESSYRNENFEINENYKTKNIINQVLCGEKKVKFMLPKKPKFKQIQNNTRPSVRCNLCAKKRKKCERPNDSSICYGCIIQINEINSSEMEQSKKEKLLNQICFNCLNPVMVKKRNQKL